MLNLKVNCLLFDQNDIQMLLCVKLEGKLSTDRLNSENCQFFILCTNIIIFVPRSKSFNKELKLAGKVNVCVS